MSGNPGSIIFGMFVNSILQQQLKRLQLKRKDMQQQLSRGQQLQVQEGLGESLQADLHKLDTILNQIDQSMEAQKQCLEVG